MPYQIDAVYTKEAVELVIKDTEARNNIINETKRATDAENNINNRLDNLEGKAHDPISYTLLLESNLLKLMDGTKVVSQVLLPSNSQTSSVEYRLIKNANTLYFYEGSTIKNTIELENDNTDTNTTYRLELQGNDICLIGNDNTKSKIDITNLIPSIEASGKTEVYLYKISDDDSKFLEKGSSDNGDPVDINSFYEVYDTYPVILVDRNGTYYNSSNLTYDYNNGIATEKIYFTVIEPLLIGDTISHTLSTIIITYTNKVFNSVSIKEEIVSGGSGGTTGDNIVVQSWLPEQITLLNTILKATVFTSSQKSNVDALISSLNNTHITYGEGESY